MKSNRVRTHVSLWFACAWKPETVVWMLGWIKSICGSGVQLASFVEATLCQSRVLSRCDDFALRKSACWRYIKCQEPLLLAWWSAFVSKFWAQSVKGWAPLHFVQLLLNDYTVLELNLFENKLFWILHMWLLAWSGSYFAFLLSKARVVTIALQVFSP